MTQDVTIWCGALLDITPFGYGHKSYNHSKRGTALNYLLKFIFTCMNNRLLVYKNKTKKLHQVASYFFLSLNSSFKTINHINKTTLYFIVLQKSTPFQKAKTLMRHFFKRSFQTCRREREREKSYYQKSSNTSSRLSFEPGIQYFELPYRMQSSIKKYRHIQNWNNVFDLFYCPIWPPPTADAKARHRRRQRATTSYAWKIDLHIFLSVLK